MTLHWYALISKSFLFPKKVNLIDFIKHRYSIVFQTKQSVLTCPITQCPCLRHSTTSLSSSNEYLPRGEERSWRNFKGPFALLTAFSGGGALLLLQFPIPRRRLRQEIQRFFFLKKTLFKEKHSIVCHCRKYALLVFSEIYLNIQRVVVEVQLSDFHPNTSALYSEAPTRNLSILHSSRQHPFTWTFSGKPLARTSLFKLRQILNALGTRRSMVRGS